MDREIRAASPVSGVFFLFLSSLQLLSSLRHAYKIRHHRRSRSQVKCAHGVTTSRPTDGDNLWKVRWVIAMSRKHRNDRLFMLCQAHTLRNALIYLLGIDVLQFNENQ
jgi:hypothetical protein